MALAENERVSVWDWIKKSIIYSTLDSHNNKATSVTYS